MKYTRRSPWSLLFRFHRYAGLSVGIIVLILAITGIFLNHSTDLALDRKTVKSNMLLDWYGIKPPAVNAAFAVGKSWLIQLDEQIFLDSNPVQKTRSRLTGAVITPEFIAVAFDDSVMMLTPKGQLIEKIAGRPVSRIGIDIDNNIYVISDGQLLFSGDGLLTWRETDQQPAGWSMPGTLPEALRIQLEDKARQSVLTYERFFLDLHSGRLFGSWGSLFIDLCAVLLILVTISGIWIWVRHKIKQARGLRNRNQV